MRSTLRSRLGSTPRSARRLRPAAAGAAVAALALAALAGCTGTGSSDAANTNSRPAPVDGAGVSPAPPGKYRTLPQPCSAVDLDSLKQLVPGATDYAGAEALTYDTDRLVGCAWKGRAADGSTSSLSLSVVRVVSYNPAVSDEVEAESDFEQKAAAASIPSAPPSGGPTTNPQTTPPTSSGSSTANPDTGGTNSAGSASGGTQSSGTASGGTDAGGTDAGGTPSAGSTGTGSSNGANAAKDSNSADSSSPDLAPRRLSHVGNTAFIDDVLKTRASGPNRTVTLVFRTANVIATVTYSQSAPHDAPSPKSLDLQKAAQKVAGELEGKVEG